MFLATFLFLLITLPQYLGQSCLITTFDQVINATRDCKDIIIANLTVPAGVTLKLNLTDGAAVTFKGRITFEFFPWHGPLVTINGTGITIQGDEGHVIDGQGEQYWDGYGDWGIPKPNFFTIQAFGGSVIKDINVINSPHDLVQVTNSDNVTYTNWFYNNSAGNQVANATLNCKDIVIENLTVPAGVTLKLNLTDGATVTFKGRTTFEFTPWNGPLVTINGTGITIQGDEGHIFDGQGEKYWDGQGGAGVAKPNFFTIQTFGGSVIKNISAINAPHDLVQVTNSDNVVYTNWFYNNSAGDRDKRPTDFARNTDGFEVWNSTNVLISDSLIYNQDDCVALRCGSNITVLNLECHNSHGLSISVGFMNDTGIVDPLNTLTNVYFADSSLYGGSNGIHIKTHNAGGLGLIQNVTYENIFLSGADTNGISIEQNYPNSGEPPRNNVPIKNLTIKNFYGKVEPKSNGIYVLCAENGCENWYWEDVAVSGSSKNNSCNYKFPGSSACDN